MSKMTKELCKIAYDLRAQGKSWVEIGEAMNISRTYARHLAKYNESMQSRTPVWTEGLTPTLGAAIRKAGFTSKSEVLKMINENPNAMLKYIGIDYIAIEKLKNWCSQ